MTRDIKILSLTLLLAATGLTTAAATETRKLESLIRNELIYPRELYYTIPFETSDAAVDGGHLSAGEELEKMKMIKIEREGDRIRFVPAKDTFDVIRQNVNMGYKIESLSILLCTADIMVKEIKHADGKTTVYGETYLKNKTKAYEGIVAALPSEKRREYLPRKIEWQITGGEGSPEITERAAE